MRRHALSSACLRVTALAVTRFDASGTHAQIAFGLAVLLIEHLRGVSDLRVVPGRQSLAASNDELTPEEIGRASGVDAVLTGSLRIEGEALEVTVLLVDPLTEREIWTDRYAVHCHDVLQVCRGVAERVCEAIGREPAFGRRPLTSSAYAWDAFCAYAAARALDWFGDDDALPRVARLYERAAVLAPGLLPAVAARAFAALSLIADGRQSRAQLDAITGTAVLALRRDRSLADACAAAGLACLLAGKPRKAEQHLRRAARLDPFSSRTRRFLADALDALGLTDEARRERAAARGDFAGSLPALYTDREICSSGET